MEHNAYKQLAESLNALPNGFPSTDDGRELKLLAKLFTPEEAELAAQLQPALETVEEIAARTGRDASGLRDRLKGMSRRGLIAAGKKDDALGFRLMPFVVRAAAFAWFTAQRARWVLCAGLRRRSNHFRKRRPSGRGSAWPREVWKSPNQMISNRVIICRF